LTRRNLRITGIVKRLTTWTQSTLGLIRFGGHLSKGEYDVQTDGRHTEAGAPPVHR
jgi:hypothetical protein